MCLRVSCRESRGSRIVTVQWQLAVRFAAFHPGDVHVTQLPLALEARVCPVCLKSDNHLTLATRSVTYAKLEIPVLPVN